MEGTIKEKLIKKIAKIDERIAELEANRCAYRRYNSLENMRICDIKTAQLAMVRDRLKEIIQ